MTIAKMIDHTALKPDTTKEQILTLTKEARIRFCFRMREPNFGKTFR